MGKKCIILFILVFRLTGLGALYASEDMHIPSHDGKHAVIDAAHILTEGEKDRIEKLCRSYQKTVAIVVLTVPDFDGYTVEEYAQEVFDRWKIGQKGTDNGALFLYGANVPGSGDNLRIHTGNGVEGWLPDILAGRILSDQVAPLWQADTAGAIKTGVKAIYEAAIQAKYDEQVARERSAQHARQMAEFWARVGEVALTGAIIVAILSPFALLWYVLWKRRRIRIARKAVADLETEINNAANAATKAHEVLVSLQGNGFLPDKSIRSIMQRAVELMRQVSLMVETTKDEIPNGLDVLEHDRQATQSRVGVMGRVLEELNGLVEYVNSAESRYRNMPTALSAAYMQAKESERTVSHPDVSSEIRERLGRLLADVPEESLLRMDPKQVDFSEAFGRLQKTTVALRAIAVEAVKWVEQVEEARTSVPRRLKELQGRLSRVEKEVRENRSSIPRLSTMLREAVALFASAASLITRGEWLSADASLDAIEKAFRKIQQEIEDHEEKKRKAAYRPTSYSSPSYPLSGGFSSSSSSFGGFGGGMSSGGGASIRV
ncbi:MAG: hypothetical protein HGA33_00995 [Candidatus Moranbacteria bacterium]|nr:hypothetical protein [Candidatus Moranbacteria bacterium]